MRKWGPGRQKWRQRQPTPNETIMPVTAIAASPPSHVQPVAAPPAAAAAPTTRAVAKVAAQPAAAAASAVGSVAQQRAALTRMLATYKQYQSHGADAGMLSKLGKQILAAAKALGQHVTLPRAPANAGAAQAAPAASAAPGKGKVNITA